MPNGRHSTLSLCVGPSGVYLLSIWYAGADGMPWLVVQYVYIRQRRELDVEGRKVHVILAQSTSVPQFAERPGVIRVKSYKQSLAIESDGKKGSKGKGGAHVGALAKDTHTQIVLTVRHGNAQCVFPCMSWGAKQCRGEHLGRDSICLTSAGVQKGCLNLTASYPDACSVHMKSEHQRKPEGSEITSGWSWAYTGHQVWGWVKSWQDCPGDPAKTQRLGACLVF